MGHNRGRPQGPAALGARDEGGHRSCTAFFEDLKRRGLADPLLAVTDSAAGLIRAVETCFPWAVRQRCLVHRMRNLRSKAPESHWPEIALRARLL